MKRVPKLIKIPEPLHEAMRIVKFAQRVDASDYILEALASKLEGESDPAIQELVTRYRGESAHQVEGKA